MVGLTSEIAGTLIKTHGYNEIESTKKASVFSIFIGQYKDVFSLLLIATAILSLVLTYFGFTEDYLDFFLIIAILLINGLIGTFQEYKAEKTLEKLKNMQRTVVRVYRDEQLVSLDSKFLVPGDIILLEEGEKITADCRLIEGNLTVDESSFTGEAYPVIKKETETVYSGTFCTNGSTKLEVIYTGKKTRFGELASKVANMDELSFFKTQLNTFTDKLIRFIIVVIILFFFIGFFRGQPFVTMLLAAVALGVAVVPEGLAATTIITMMSGINRLMKKNVLVKKIDAIQVLGATNYLVFDKTGTLTKGEIKVDKVRGSQKLLDYLGYFAIPNSKDPVEIALKEYANTNGFKEGGKIVKVNNFDYESRTSSILWEFNQSRQILFAKGAPESIFKKCGRMVDITPLLDEGYRVIAFAKREVTWELLGVVAFVDPIRSDAKSAIKLMQDAGIYPVLITGDHEKTAKYVSNKLNLPQVFLSGGQLQEMRKEEAYELLKRGGVVYRALPETKMYLVKLYQNKNKVVASTGDGVNDVLLLKKADVGIAMGVKGTDVAKEAADLVLLDDSLSTIINGIIEGRGIIANIRKFIIFLLTCNVAEAAANLIFPFISARIPFDAPKLLWINLVTDGLPAVAFGVDPVHKELIEDKPEAYRFLLTDKMRKVLLYVGISTGIMVAILFYVTLQTFVFELAVTVTFTTLVLSEIIRVFIVRYLFREPWLYNGWMIFALIASALVQLILVYTPLGQLFDLVPITGLALLVMLGFLVGMFLIDLTIAALIRSGKI